MNVNARRDSDFDKYKWPVLALWISLGLHGALIALVKIVPPREGNAIHTIEARLMPVSHMRDVPLYLPDLKSPALGDVLAYALQPAPLDPVQQPLSTQPTQTSPIPQIEMPLAVDLHYYNARELDVMPNGSIPEPGLPARLSGRIKYQIKIEEDGRVSDVDVLSVELMGDADSVALTNTKALLRATRFTPAMKNGRPVRAMVVYELVIEPVIPTRP